MDGIVLDKETLEKDKATLQGRLKDLIDAQRRIEGAIVYINEKLKEAPGPAREPAPERTATDATCNCPEK